ncbi:type II toxin-antitoxin system RelE family toxin [Pseudomonas sp. SP16.1]|uniref:type II toxin-antitoxin system RelE family toxin n=1 Tax=Pseudomonas sp. SP16.1 TaxID=3458854 RepID=UPI00404525FD
MYRLEIHEHAKQDILGLLESEPVAAYRILALLEELEGDQDKLDRLTQQGYGGSPSKPVKGATFNVKYWVEARNGGLNLWRLRDFDLSNQGLEYRIIYAFFPNESAYFVLGIAKREFNYDQSHMFTQRIYRDYRALEVELW